MTTFHRDKQQGDRAQARFESHFPGGGEDKLEGYDGSKLCKLRYECKDETDKLKTGNVCIETYQYKVRGDPRSGRKPSGIAMEVADMFVHTWFPADVDSNRPDQFLIYHSPTMLATLKTDSTLKVQSFGKSDNGNGGYILPIKRIDDYTDAWQRWAEIVYPSTLLLSDVPGFCLKWRCYLCDAPIAAGNVTPDGKPWCGCQQTEEVTP